MEPGHEIDLPRPYETEEIEKRPYPVIISLLIGLLLLTVTLFIRNDSQLNGKIDQLRDKTDSLNYVRIQMYEQMIFFRDQWQNSRATQDSTLRNRTETYVNQILIKEK